MLDQDKEKDDQRDRFQPRFSEADPLICTMLEPTSSNSHDQFSDQTPKSKPRNQGPKNRSKNERGFLQNPQKHRN